MSAALRLALEVAAAWLMPWRAARRIADLDQSLDYMVSAFASVVLGDGHRDADLVRDCVVRRLADALVASQARVRELEARPDPSPVLAYCGRHLKGVPRRQ